jgi:hypothetical protein
MELNCVLLNKFGWADGGNDITKTWQNVIKSGLPNKIIFNETMKYADWSFQDDSRKISYILFSMYDRSKNLDSKKLIGYRVVSISNNRHENCILFSDVKTNSELFRYIIDNMAFCKEYKRNYEIVNLLK